MEEMTIEDAVTALDAISGRNQGGDHAKADEILMRVADASVRDAYERLMDHSNGWWFE